jgi:hypothetical protein
MSDRIIKCVRHNWYKDNKYYEVRISYEIAKHGTNEVKKYYRSWEAAASDFPNFRDLVYEHGPRKGSKGSYPGPLSINHCNRRATLI